MEKLLTKERLEMLISSGVNIICSDSVFISENAKIESGVTIYPNNHIYGTTFIKSGAVIEPDCQIYDSVIMENAVVTKSVIKLSVIKSGATVGPFAYVRPGTEIGENCRVGDFVEVKNSKIGNGTKIAHLTYVGDAEIGENCNLGCGIVFANYDGTNKNRTKIGDNCFLGSNCNFIAPVCVGDNCFIAAATTITKNVESGKFVIVRVRQEENAKLADKYINKNQ